MACRTTSSATNPGTQTGRRTITARRARQGFTLSETMVTLGVGSILLAAILAFWSYSARSLAGMVNYIDLDQRSRHALDNLSREIRQAAGVLSATETSLTLSNLDGSLLQITWDPERRVVTLNRNGEQQTLLVGCDYFRFNIAQRTPSNGVFGFYPTRDIRQAKLVDMSWRCSRSVLGNLLQTESVQTARIVLRN